MRLRHARTLLAGLALAACADAPTLPAPAVPAEPSASDADLLGGRIIVTTGKGQYTIGALVIDFSHAAVQVGHDAPFATGTFRHSLLLGGALVEFEGKVTCLAIDEANGRAWVGGVVTKNNSTNTGFTTPIHQVGRDVWFRMVDYGEGRHQVQPDRITFLGFEGAAGFITSADYCAGRPWPDADDRTNPVIDGNLQVH